MALKILHLEDNAADAELVKHALRRARVDCEIENVDSAEAYERALSEGFHDVILSDSGIPGYDGRTALKRALEGRPGVPFIVVSGSVDGMPSAVPHELQPTAQVSKARIESLPDIIKASVQRDQAPRVGTGDQVRGMQQLISVIQSLSMARDLPSVMNIVRQAARRLVNADGATFVLRDQGRCYYADEDAIAPLWKGQRFAMEACISGWAMLNRRAVAIPDIDQDDRIPQDAYRPTFVKSLVMTPIRTAEPVGAIGVYWAASHGADDHEIALLSALADSTSVAMESVNLIANLESRVARRTVEGRERQAELEALNDELDAFSYAVAHDLRSPLLNIHGFAQLLAESYGPTLTGEGLEYLDRITSATARMQGLLNDLLALSRIVRAPMNPIDVDLALMARDIAVELRHRTPDRLVDFSADKAVARADPGMTRIVLENLLTNAWKFTSKTARARIRFGVAEHGERMTTFFLRDNGAGFDPRHASRLFSPFHRLHTQEQFPGTGVGLATVRRIVRRHGGEIRAEGAVNDGAIFHFSLPAVDAGKTKSTGA